MSDLLNDRHNPLFNHSAISLIQQEDGNWIGEIYKYGKVIEVRDVSPETVLVRLLTHDGQG